MQNSFLTGIGLAIYFGFSEINLIGFDYLSLRPRLYHFYENDIDIRAENQQINISPVFLNELSKLININYIYIFENKSKYFNSLVVLNHKLEIISLYNKINLVPFGEFLPFEKILSNFGFKKITLSSLSIFFL